MSEDTKTLWVGNLDNQVTEELLYELFLQTGPIEKLVLPTEGEGEHKKHKGHAYIVFHHPESVQYASQVLDGSSLFGHPLTMKARPLPVTYKSSTNVSGNKGRFDGSSKPGFNKATTWHGQSDFSTHGRGSFRGRGGGSNYNQSTGYSTNYNNYNNQSNSSFWASGQQSSSDTQAAPYSTANSSLDEKRQRLLQQQNLTLETHRQIQQGVMNMATQMYGMVQQNQQQQQGMWAANNGFSNTNWNMTGSNNSSFQGFSTNQFGSWYQQQ